MRNEIGHGLKKNIKKKKRRNPLPLRPETKCDEKALKIPPKSNLVMKSLIEAKI